MTLKIIFKKYIIDLWNKTPFESYKQNFYE